MNMRRAAPVIIIVVTLAALYPVATCDFTTWDDLHNVTGNPHVNTPSLDGLKSHWLNAWSSLYIPVTYTVWIAVASVAKLDDGSLNPWLFHAANLAFHIGSALMVLSILRRLKFDPLAACGGALVFAVHPVQVESVAWISGLKDVLAGFFALVAIDQYIAAATSERRRAFAFATSIIAFVLAMLSKPSAVAVPLVLVVIDVLLLKRSMRQVLKWTAAFFVLTIPIIVIGKLAQPATQNTPVPMWWRPFVAAEAVAFYLWKIVWPIKLGIDYGHSPQWVMRSGLGYYAWLLPAALVALLIARRATGILAAAGILVAALLPVLGFVPFEYQEKSTVADHYLYLPMLAVALVVATIVTARRSARIVIGVLILLLATRSWLQTSQWSDSRTLYLGAIKINQTSALAYNNLCVVALDERNGPEAERYARKLLELHPDEPRNVLNLAGALAMQDRFAEAESIYHEAVNRWPENLDAHVGRSLALLDLRRLDESRKEYDAAAAIDLRSPRVTDLRSRIERASQP